MFLGLPAVHRKLFGTSTREHRLYVLIRTLVDGQGHRGRLRLAPARAGDRHGIGASSRACGSTTTGSAAVAAGSTATVRGASSASCAGQPGEYHQESQHSEPVRPPSGRQEEQQEGDRRSAGRRPEQLLHFVLRGARSGRIDGECRSQGSPTRYIDRSWRQTASGRIRRSV